MTRKNKKIAIIGAGHNSLVCAAYLAKAGFSVNVYETRSDVGGMASTRELAEGYKVPGAAHLLHQVDSKIHKSLKLDKHGLAYVASGLKTISINPNGNALVFDDDNITGDDITLREQEQYKEFRKTMKKLAGFFKKAYQKAPPRLGSEERRDLSNLMSLGWNLRSMGKDSMRLMLKFIAVNIHDVLNEYFDHEHIKGSIALDALLGNRLGPRTNNSSITYLHQLTGDLNGVQGSYGIPEGGMSSYSDSLQKAAESAGVNIHTNSPIKQIDLDAENKIRGLVLESGETIEADVVVSGIDPRSTFMCLVGPKHLESHYVHKISNIRMRGNTSKLHLALSGLPKFKGVDKEDLGNRIINAPNMKYLELAHDFTKYGEYSDQLPMEIIIPSIHDKTLAPKGHHVLSAIVNNTAYHLKDGWEQSKPVVLENCLNQLEEMAPGIRKLILHAELLSPKDFEDEYGITGGHWHQGELTFDQFLMLRPIPGMAQYTSPIESLYLCGAGSHPGGGLMGLAGRNAANEILSRES